MANLGKRFFTEIRSHLLYDLAKYVAFVALSMIVAAAVFLYGVLRGYPRDLVLTGATFVSAFLLMIIAVTIARYAKKKEYSQSSSGTEADQPERRALTQIVNEPSLHPCGDARLHKIADKDRGSLDSLVTITAIDPQAGKIMQGVAYIEFIFYIFNSS